MAQTIDLAILGGSGFYAMPGLTDVEEIAVDTPFGPPSDALRVGTLCGRRVAFLARHGRHHSLLPGEIPQRANFWALKSLAVQRVVAVSAVGSLRADYPPGEPVVPDQLIDRTNGTRPATFFGQGVVAHVPMAEPFCGELRESVLDAARQGGVVHNGGSYVVIEGPAFGTRAESELYRAWNASVVGMTALPEAKLAREAEICYAIIATPTDYDSWHASHESVTASTVFEVLARNVEASRATVERLVEGLPASRSCTCGTTLDAALVTPPDHLTPDVRHRLAPILARRLGEGATS